MTSSYCLYYNENGNENHDPTDMYVCVDDSAPEESYLDHLPENGQPNIPNTEYTMIGSGDVLYGTCSTADQYIHDMPTIECLSHADLIEFVHQVRCAEPQCLYSKVRTQCAHGCDQGKCLANPENDAYSMLFESYF